MGNGRQIRKRRATAAADNHFHRPNFVDLLDALVIGLGRQLGHNIFSQPAAQVLVRKPKLGECGAQEIACRAVVETDDGNLAAGNEACIVELVVETQRHGAFYKHHGRWAAVKRDYSLTDHVSTRFGERLAENVFVGQSYPAAQQRRPAGLDVDMAEVDVVGSTCNRDPTVTQRNKMVDSLLRHPFKIKIQPAVFTRFLAPAKGNEGKFPAIEIGNAAVLPLRLRQNDTVHKAPFHHPPQMNFRILVAAAKVHDKLQATPGQKSLEAIKNRHEERFATVGAFAVGHDHEPDEPCGSLPQASAGLVGRVAKLLRAIKNALPGLLIDAGPAIQCPGNRANGDFEMPRDIVDVHAAPADGFLTHRILTVILTMSKARAIVRKRLRETFAYNRPVRWLGRAWEELMYSAVLVGCGAMSKAWLEATAKVKNLSIAGLVDVDIERANGRAIEFGLDKAVVGTDLGSVLSQTNPTMVFDVALPQVRLELARTAFTHGCHVLTEKPMASNIREAQEIIRLSREAKRLHAVVQNRRYLGDVRRIRRFLDSGILGKPTSIHCDFFIAPHFGGFREEMDHVLLVDMAIHTFDAARYMVNAEAVDVFCREWEPSGSWYRNGACALAVFTLSNGAVLTYRGSWCAKGFKTSWESSWRIICEKGSLIWDGFDDMRAEVDSGIRDGLFDKLVPVSIPAFDERDAVGGHLGVIREFLKAVDTSTEPETRGSDNIKSLAMVFGAVESSAVGRPVKIAV